MRPSVSRRSYGRQDQHGCHGRRGGARWWICTAAQSAQLGLVGVRATELGRERVTVNAVSPGRIPVERHAGADTAAYEAQVPLGRMGVPADVAGAVACLLSDAAAFVTDQVLTGNGGHVL